VTAAISAAILNVGADVSWSEEHPSRVCPSLAQCHRHVSVICRILALKEKVQEGKYKPLPQYFSAELKSVIAMILQVDPSKRPTAE
jgi:hypothetical protein